MNTPLRRAAKTAALFAGALFFWSSWTVSPLRFALMNLHPSPPATQALHKTPSAQQRYEAAKTLGDALRDPKAISDRDVHSVRGTWGDEAARLLTLIR